MKPDKTGEALIVIDMLNDFVLPGAPLEVPDARAIIPVLRRTIKSVRTRGIPVIYLCDSHDEDDPEFGIWPRHAVKGSPGAQVVDQLAPAAGDEVVTKTTYSAFYETRLEETLDRMGVKTLTLVGIMTNICVFFTAVEAVVRGFDVRIPRDGVAALSDREHQFALEQMEKVLKVRLI